MTRFKVQGSRFKVYRDPQAGEDPPAGGEPPASGEPPAGGGDPPLEIPERFLVNGADGNPDFKAIYGKVSQSYTELEKRMKETGLPPETAEGYQLERFLPETHEENREALAPILAKFHAAGLTNKQVQAVMNVFGEQFGVGIANEKAAFDAAQTQLKEAWGDNYESNHTDMRKAVAVYADGDERKQLEENPKYMNDPLLANFLAKVGADLGEDRLPVEFQASGGEDIDALRKSEAYTNPRHADHRATVEKVNAAYRRGYKSKAA